MCSQPLNTTPQKNSKLKTVLSFPFIVLIKFYQYVISPAIGPKCRYTPTCSQYGLQAFKKYGPIKGFWLTAKRVSKCHPWGGSGYDPLPPPNPLKGERKRTS